MRHGVPRSPRTQLPRLPLGQLDLERTLRHDAPFDAQQPVPSTDRARITDREHLASSCSEALQEARALRPDVVLVDLSLGEESGFDVARRLVEDSRAGGMTVILISTHSEADFADLIAESPAAGFLPKSELSASAIRKILEESRER